MRALVVLACALSLAGCDRVRDCKKGTLFVDAHYPAGVDHVTVDVELPGGLHGTGTLVNPSGQTSGGAEIDFHTYPATGTMVTIHLRAYMGETIIAGTSATATIADGCTKISVTLDGSETDGGAIDFGPGGDLSTPSCDPGKHYCQNVAMCVSDDSIDHCATSCDPCPAVTHGTQACAPTTGCSPTCDTGFVMSGALCDVGVPRQVAPLSNVITESRTPQFEWVLAPNTDGAHLDVCTDRACTNKVYSADVTGTTHTPTSDLPANSVLFWRVAGIVGGTTGTLYGPVWEFQALRRTAAPSTTFGRLSDFNNDGYGDFVVGDDNPSGAGSIYVHYGSSTGPKAAATTIYTGASTEQFGFAIAMLGDANGDGYADLAVGEFGHGKAFVIYGSATGLDTSTIKTLTQGAGSNMDFGDRVTAAGDLNGDGYADLFVGGYHDTTQGGWIFYGGPSGIPTTPSATLTLPVGAAWFGYSSAGAGDVNHDGYGDLFVGDNVTAVVHVYLGSATGINAAMPSQTILSPGMAAGFGLGLAGCDCDGDGYADLIATSQSTKQAWYFKGISTGIASSNSGVATGSNSYGQSVDCADIDGNGYPDISISTSNATTQQFYLSNGSFNPNPTNVTTPANTGSQMAAVGDTDSDGYWDFVVGTPQASNAQVQYIGGSSGGPKTPVVYQDTGTSGRYGISVQ